MKTRIAVLCSGGGSNLQAILDAIDAGEIPGQVVLVVSNRKSAHALERARARRIEACFLSRKELGDRYDDVLLRLLQAAQADLVVLAGYLAIVGPQVVSAYRGRMMNIHPALLPDFGGMGMYGHHVHEAVLQSGAPKSGVTVHFVDEKADHGPIIAQREVPVLPGDTPDTLADRVLREEHILLPDCVKAFCEGRIHGNEPGAGENTGG